MAKYKTDYGTVKMPGKAKAKKMKPRHLPKTRGEASRKGLAEDLGKL